MRIPPFVKNPKDGHFYPADGSEFKVNSLSGCCECLGERHMYHFRVIEQARPLHIRWNSLGKPWPSIPMHKERILFIDLGSDYGGVETYLKNLSCLLAPYVEGYAVLSLPKLAAELRAQGMTVVCLPILGSKWLKALRLLIACFVVPYLLGRFNIQTVQLNGFFESLLLAPLRLLGRKTIYTMHNPFQTDLYPWFRDPARRLPRFLSKHSLQFATQVICVSEAIGTMARTILPAEHVTVIANWVESPATIRRGFSTPARPQLLFVGRLEEYKGVQFILRAMQRIPEVSLLVVGEGSYRPQLEAEAARLDVRFTGFQADPSRYYQESTVFINPSLGPEGLPLVSLEAMAHGLPCLFSDLPVHREITAEGQAAALFTCGDSESLARQLRSLLASEVGRQRYSLAARGVIARKYSVTGAAQQYIRAFGLREALAGG